MSSSQGIVVVSLTIIFSLLGKRLMVFSNASWGWVSSQEITPAGTIGASQCLIPTLTSVRGTVIGSLSHKLSFHLRQALSRSQLLMELFWLRRRPIDPRSSPIRGERLSIDTVLDKIYQQLSHFDRNIRLMNRLFFEPNQTLTGN